MEIKFALSNWAQNTKLQICSTIFRTECWFRSQITLPNEKAIWLSSPTLTQTLSNQQQTTPAFSRHARPMLLVLLKTQKTSWRRKEIRRLSKNSTRNLTHQQDQSGMLRKQIDQMSFTRTISLKCQRGSLRKRLKVWT